MSLTNGDLKSIKTIVSDTVNTAVEGAEQRLRSDFRSEILASEHRLEQRLLSKIFAYSDAKYEQLSIQMEAGFTHVQNQLRKSLRS